ncbi:hypothetical protein Ancab_008476 [Ancistrocladus abbreviatus]
MASSSKLSKKEFLSPSLPQPHPSKSNNKVTNDPNDKNLNPPGQSTSTNIPVLSPSPEDIALSMSSHLTRQEVLRRRLRHVKQLSRVYRDYYWALMEELRVQYREYYWKYGVSPFQEEVERETGEREVGTGVKVEGSGETNNNNNNVSINLNNGGGKSGLGFGEGGLESKLLGGQNRCAFVGCKLKAMALTSFCHLHILSDPQQKLYKACNYVIKSAQAGPIICGKPILRAAVPSLCNVHFQKGQKHVTRALKKAGLNVASSSKLAPKFHVIVAEYVRQIQAKRRAAQRPNENHNDNIVSKEESGS